MTSAKCLLIDDETTVAVKRMLPPFNGGHFEVTSDEGIVVSIAERHLDELPIPVLFADLAIYLLQIGCTQRGEEDTSMLGTTFIWFTPDETGGMKEFDGHDLR